MAIQASQLSWNNQKIYNINRRKIVIKDTFINKCTNTKKAIFLELLFIRRDSSSKKKKLKQFIPRRFVLLIRV